MIPLLVLWLIWDERKKETRGELNSSHLWYSGKVQYKSGRLEMLKTIFRACFCMWVAFRVKDDSYRGGAPCYLLRGILFIIKNEIV